MSLKHLVIDTNYVLSRVADLRAEHVYATPEVVAEIKDEQSQQYLNALDYFSRVEVRVPSAQSLERI